MVGELNCDRHRLLNSSFNSFWEVTELAHNTPTPETAAITNHAIHSTCRRYCGVVDSRLAIVSLIDRISDCALSEARSRLGLGGSDRLSTL